MSKKNAGTKPAPRTDATALTPESAGEKATPNTSRMGAGDIVTSQAVGPINSVATAAVVELSAQGSGDDAKSEFADEKPSAADFHLAAGGMRREAANSIGEPGVEAILPAIDLAVAPVGYVQRKPNPRLSPEEAEMQAHLYHALVAGGLSLRDQGGVYPWLLRQVRAAVGR